MYQKSGNDKSAAVKHRRKYQGITTLLLVLLITSLLSACGSDVVQVNSTNTAGAQKSEQGNSSSGTTNSSEVKQSNKIKDFYGEKEIEAYPTRIAVIGLEDVALSLDAPIVYAFGFKGYYLQDELESRNIQTSGNDIKPNVEAILAAQPDLILLQKNFTDEKGYEDLNKIAPTLAFDPEDWKGTATEIGKALGIEEKTQSVIHNYDAKLAQAKDAIIKAVGPDKTAVYMRPSNKDLQVFFPSFAPLVYEQLGLKPDVSITNFQKQSPDDWGINTSLESLPLITADYVFAIYGGSISPEEEFNQELAESTLVENLSLWKQMPAVKANHVTKVSARTWMSSGPIANSKVIDDILAAVTGE